MNTKNNETNSSKENGFGKKVFSLIFVGIISLGIIFLVLKNNYNLEFQMQLQDMSIQLQLEKGEPAENESALLEQVDKASDAESQID